MSGIVGSKLNIKGSGLVGSVGTDGQHMLSSGVGKTHAFETVAAGGGAWKYIARQTLASDAADITFREGVAATDGTPDFGSDYAAVMFLMEHFTPADDLAQSRLYISTDGGSSYLTDSYLAITSYNEGYGSGVAKQPMKAVDNYRLGTVTHNDIALGLNGFVYLYNTSDTGHNPFASWHFSDVYNDGSRVRNYKGGAFHTTDQNVDAVKFGFHSGNVLAASTIRMYGLTAS